jgi:hypothetical protein
MKPIKIFAVLVISLMVISCSSLKKTTSSESAKTELTHVVSSDSTSLKKTDSTGEKKAAEINLVKKDSSTTNVQEEEETEKITVKLEPGKPGKKPANDYDGAPDQDDDPEIFDVTIDGKRIKSTQPIKEIVVENRKGKKTIQASDIKTIDSSSKSSSQSSQVVKFDSSASHRDDSLRIAAESKKQSSTKKRSGFSLGAKIGTIAGLIIFVILAIYFGWFPWILRRFAGLFRWLFGLFKRKKKDQDQSHSPPDQPVKT